MKRPLPKTDLAEHIRQGTIEPGCYEEYLRSLPYPGQEAAEKASGGFFDDDNELWNDELSRTYDAIKSRETRELEGSQRVAATQKDDVQGGRKAKATQTQRKRGPKTSKLEKAMEAMGKLNPTFLDNMLEKELVAEFGHIAGRTRLRDAREALLRKISDK